MLKDADAVVEVITIQMSSAAAALSEEGLLSAVDTAMTELGWSFPLTDPNKIFWVTKRSVRHACHILWVASALKFKYKQVNLDQRFTHYEKLIKSLDTEFETAMSDQAALFAGVDSYQLFGTAVGNGFVYDAIGRDITYDDLTLFINSEE